MAQTPKWGLPYPEQDTPITDSAAIVQELAEKIDAALSAVTASDTYTVPGTLIANMTTSGTFTPPQGVTVVHVVVIGGGGNGAKGKDASNVTGCGGSGGGVRVFRGVPVSGPIAVSIGGQGTESSFGAVTAPGGMNAAGTNDVLGAPGLSRNLMGLGNGGAGEVTHGGNSLDYGQPGPAINGTRYGGGGGGVEFGRGFGAPANGGAGGGGSGARYASGGSILAPESGTNGTGGGGGGANYGGTGSTPGLGGSGRVMVYTEQPTMRRNAPTPDPDPMIVAALDDHGTMTGAYAVDAARELPDPGVRVVDYPTAPVDTGRTVTAPADPDDPDGPTVEAPVLAWPVAGWTYTESDGWKDPA